jgi:PAS domain S-box-containing protein
MDADSYFPWAQSKLKNRETVCVPSTANVPREAAVDQKTWGVFGIKSTLGFPLSVGDGPVFGVLSFDATEKEREWPPALVNRLQLLGQVFANALARKRTEQALSESEARLRMAAASANAGLWTLNPTTGQIWSTEKTKELFGVPPTEELDVKKLLNLVHPDDREAVDCVIENAIESGEDTSVEYRIIRPDGQIRWISACGRLHSGGFREPGQLMGVSVDITERRLAQEELQRSYSEIKELKERIQTESDYLQEEIKHIGRYDEIVGQSKTLKYVLKKVEQVAHTDSVVLITGETGTGKELIARAIHNLSKQKDRVMVKVDCAALPPTLIESELFGREKGAYTGAVSRQIGRFETANGSTLFLDEIGELGVEVQAKLLRIVQDGEFERLGTTRTTQVNVRLIAATHRDLAELVKNGTFREDLFYRLNVFPILVPPLRERQEDIPLLVSAFIREFEKKMGKKISTVASKTMDELKRYPWPGNIRELRNIIERAVIVTTGERLNLQMPKTLNGASTRTLQETEVQHILTTLEKTGWRIKGPNGAALILGIKPSTLYTMMHRLRIPTRHEKGGIQS